MLSLAEARALFPTCRENMYLDTAARAVLADPVRRAIEGLLAELQQDGGNRDEWVRVAREAKERYAELIGAHPEEIAWTKNVSEGVNIFANALPWQPGDNVVVIQDHEHPNAVYTWYNLRRLGVQTRVVPAPGGVIDLRTVAAAMDRHTRVVSVCGVSFHPGARANLPALSALCRPRSALLFVDGAQMVGTLHVDVQAMGIDALATTVHKGLLCLYGAGLLYCRSHLIDRLQPAYLSRSGVVAGDLSDEYAGGPEAYTLAPGAKRFELGNLNYLAAHALHAALAILLSVGTERIEAHVLFLARHLAAGLDELGLPVLSPRQEHGISSIVTCRAGTPEQVQHTWQYLRAHRVQLSVRRGDLRFSFHLFNTAEEVDSTLRLLTDALRR